VETAAYGWVLARMGEVREAMSCLQDISRMQEVRRTQGWPCGTAGPIDFWLGDGYLALGRLADAQRCAQDRLDATHIGYARPLGLYLLAEIARARGVHTIVASIDSENTPSIVLFESVRLRRGGAAQGDRPEVRSVADSAVALEGILSVCRPRPGAAPSPPYGRQAVCYHAATTTPGTRRI